MQNNEILQNKCAMQKNYSVMIVDDHPLMRRGIRQLLELDPAFSVVAEASNGGEAVALATQVRTDLILLDLNMKGLSGLDTLKALRNEGIDAYIVILTVSDARNDVYALIDAGADAYLLKDTEPEQLLQDIHQVAQGKNVLSEAIKDYLIARPTVVDPLSVLTERELDVLHEVACGMSNKQIAAQLHISEETVKVHIRNLLRKLDVRSRVAATVIYLEQRSQSSPLIR